MKKFLIVVLVLLLLCGAYYGLERAGVLPPLFTKFCSKTCNVEKGGEQLNYSFVSKQTVNGKFFVTMKDMKEFKQHVFEVPEADYNSAQSGLFYVPEKMKGWKVVSQMAADKK